jgi:two-component system cell cycle sensor histidine kinase PleC
LSGHAKLFAQPAYERLIGAEPFLKHLIPILIVAFLVVVATARFLNISENHDRLRSCRADDRAVAGGGARDTVGRSGAGCARASLGNRSAPQPGHPRNARYRGRYLLVLDGNDARFAATAGG